jgi:excisionase family DNA binding protein
MKAFQTFCRKELASLEELAETWDKQWEPPIEVPGIIVDGVRDRAAKLGLVELVRKAPKDASLDEARLFLAEALAECKATQAGPEKADWLTVQQAAERLNVSPRTIYDLCEMGRLRCKRVGKGRGTIRIRPVDLEGCLAKPEPTKYRHLTI